MSEVDIRPVDRGGELRPPVEPGFRGTPLDALCARSPASPVPYLPGQAGYNKRLRGAIGLMRALWRILAADTAQWSDAVWLVDSTPVECGRSRETVKRSDLAGWAEYGYRASAGCR